MGNIAAVLDKIRAAKAAGQPSPWQFVEVMACRGGCVGGGGQPYGCTDDIRTQRAAGLYKDDEQSTIRCSHQNPLITQVYRKTAKAPKATKGRTAVQIMGGLLLDFLFI